MNYRHHFHAGNFADLLKHAALLGLLRRLQADPAPLLVVDTHAGAGGYRLEPPYLTSGEGSAAGRLADEEDAPEVMQRLRRALQRDGQALHYPGSPVLVVRTLRPHDRLLACELRRDDHDALTRALGDDPRVELVQADGYATARERLRRAQTRSLLLVDPPYERADDYDRLTALLADALTARPRTTLLVWLPLKDLETFDRVLRQVETVRPPAALVGEVRLRPLTDPMRMNGCAVLVVNDPGVADELHSACAWVAAAFGETGAKGRAWPLET